MNDEPRNDGNDAAFRASVIHGLRTRGWSRQEAEDAADEKIERLRQRRAADEATRGMKT